MKLSLLRLTLALCLTTTLCSMGCSHQPPASPDVSWVKPIYFHQETIDWLKSHRPLPEAVREDLGQIARHNQKVEAIVGGHGR